MMNSLEQGAVQESGIFILQARPPPLAMGLTASHVMVRQPRANSSAAMEPIWAMLIFRGLWINKVFP